MKKIFVLSFVSCVIMMSASVACASSQTSISNVMPCLSLSTNNPMEFEKATPVRVEAGWVTADEWHVEKGEWTGEKRLKVWRNRNGYYEIMGMFGDDGYRVERSNKSGYKYMCRFVSWIYYFNTNDF